MIRLLLPLVVLASCSAAPSGPQVRMVRTIYDVSHCGATYGTPVYEGHAPIYPACRAQGSVVVEISVGKDGVPGAVKVRISSGHPELDEAAVSAARAFRYERALEDVIRFIFINE